jgi:hypothetical protein
MLSYSSFLKNINDTDPLMLAMTIFEGKHQTLTPYSPVSNLVDDFNIAFRIILSQYAEFTIVQ